MKIKFISAFLIFNILFCNIVIAEENHSYKNLEKPDFDKTSLEISQDILEEIPEGIPEDISDIVLKLSICKEPVTYAEALRISLEKNFDIKIVTEQKERDKWFYYRKNSDFLPDFSYQYLLSKINGEFLVGQILPAKLSEIPIESTFLMEWDLFTGFRRLYDSKAAKDEYYSSKRNLEFTKEQVLLQTTIDYYRLLQRKLRVKILKKNLEQVQEQLKINTERFDAGIGTKFDVLRAKAEVANSRQLLIEAFNEFKLAQAQLANTMGIGIFTQLVPDQVRVEPIDLFENKFDIETAQYKAITTRPDIDAVRFQVKAAKNRKKSAYSIYYPNVSMALQSQDAGNTNIGLLRNYAISLVVDWKAGENTFSAGMLDVKTREKEFEKLNFQLQDKIRSVQQNTLNAYYNTITARELINVNRERLEAARESLRLAFLRLEAGVGIFIDVLQAQVSATTAEIDYLNSIIAYNITQAQLLFEMGLISVNNLLQDYSDGEQSGVEEAKQIEKQHITPVEKEKGDTVNTNE